MAKPAVVTRFAPSPTGYLHIGGARTALFNWLYARGRNGVFRLRIEDTDRARHDNDAVSAILDGLAWLGVDWDDAPVSQFARRDRHVLAAETLLEKGAAYRCYMTPEELETARVAVRENNIRFESPWRDRDPDDAPNAPFAVRFKAPRDGETHVRDAVQGDVSFPNSALDDLVILRSNGEPTYNLAVVVDDHEMGVTHIIRGDDHLNNAARQRQIYDALGWDAPVFAHVPLIHGPDGAKLSKRHGALGVEAYRDDGYLADALANYLLRLGWSHGDDEIISRAEAKAWFDLTGVNKAPARLDLDKLNHINSHYIAALDDEGFVVAAIPFLEGGPAAVSDRLRAALVRGAPALKSRCATLEDIKSAAAFLMVARPLDISGKAAKPLKKDGARQMVAAVRARLSAQDDWSSSNVLEAVLTGLAEEKGVGFGMIGAPTRAALTGGAPAPGLGEVAYALGRDETLGRLDDAVAAGGLD